MEEFPDLRAIVNQGFDNNSANVERVNFLLTKIVSQLSNLFLCRLIFLCLMLNKSQALEYLANSRGIERTRELAVKHANLASAAIDSLPENDEEDVQISRRALVELTHRVITRTK